MTIAVVGAGPAGLAVAAELGRRGVNTVVFERRDRVGAAWTGHYDRLRLNTVRWLSHLPGHRIPRRYGRWVARDDMLRYLDDYARHHRLDVRTGTDVTNVLPRDGGGWTVTVGEGNVNVDAVVVAAGYCLAPRIPDWPGRDVFAQPLVHSSAYRNATPYRGKHVLVVGAGNSGAEIAVDLAEGDTASVTMSVRTPPQIVPRTVLGIPTITIAVATRRVPPVVGDTIVGFVQRRVIGDLTPYGLPANGRPASAQFAATDVVPVSHPDFPPLLRSGRIRIVGAVERLTEDGVRLADGTEIHPDAVVAATGYDRRLRDLVSDLDVVSERDLPTVHGDQTAPSAPGLYFIGYTNPLSGNLRELAIDARRIARRIAARERPSNAGPRPWVPEPEASVRS